MNSHQCWRHNSSNSRVEHLNMLFNFCFCWRTETFQTVVLLSKSYFDFVLMFRKLWCCIYCRSDSDFYQYHLVQLSCFIKLATAFLSAFYYNDTVNMHRIVTTLNPLRLINSLTIASSMKRWNGPLKLTEESCIVYCI